MQDNVKSVLLKQKLANDEPVLVYEPLIKNKVVNKKDFEGLDQMRLDHDPKQTADFDNGLGVNCVFGYSGFCGLINCAGLLADSMPYTGLLAAICFTVPGSTAMKDRTADLYNGLGSKCVFGYTVCATTASCFKQRYA